MSVNVFTFSYSYKYYFLHPIKFIKEVIRNIKAAYFRAKYGWCYLDAWNFDAHFLIIIPQILKHLAKHHTAFPGVGNFKTSEAWEDWLNSTAEILESLQEDNWFSQNEFEEEFHKLSDLARLERQDANKMITVTFENSKELEEISILYFERMKELSEERQKLLEDTFAQISKNFFYIWD